LGIPIISEVWDGIRWLIDQFIDKAPRPLKILLFLFFLIAFGNVIIWLFHLGGVHCNTDKEVIKTDTIDIVTNVKVLYSSSVSTLTGEVVSVEEAHPWTKFIYLGSALESCSYYMKNVSGEFQFCQDFNSTGCEYYYRDADCHNCTEIDVGWVYNSDLLLNWVYVGTVCDDGARYKSKSWFGRNIACEPLCDIPEHYAWNNQEGYFECADPDYCGVNATKEPDYEIDFLLKEAGGRLLYETPNENDYRRFIQIKCSDNYNPQLTLYGIPVFDYKIWLIIIVIATMFLFLRNIKRH